MIITITWAKVIILAVCYFGGRYLYFSWMKYYTGCPDAFNPTVSYKESSYESGWQMGHIHCQQENKLTFDYQRQEIASLREQNLALLTKLLAIKHPTED